MPTARRALAQLCSDGVTESAARYAELQQIEADRAHSRSRSRRWRRSKCSNNQRGETWRRAVHDVRGNFGVIKNISDQLQRRRNRRSAQGGIFVAAAKERRLAAHAVEQSLGAVEARRGAGAARLCSSSTPPSVLKTLCDSFQPLPLERGLFLHTEGPASLPVQGDTINIQRIAQNLILNALKYTGSGGVTVVWEALETEGRATLGVFDRGHRPGFSVCSARRSPHAIEESTLEAKTVERTSPIEIERTPSERESPADIAVGLRRGAAANAGRRRRPRHRQTSL